MALFCLAAAAAAEPKVDAAVRKADRRLAGKLLAVGKEALEVGQGATANRILRRVLELRSDDRAAMKGLGFKRVKGDWERSNDDRSRVEGRRDTDAQAVAELRAKVSRTERARAKAILAACEKHSDPARERAVLSPLLDRCPRLADVHEALGHSKKGANYVRPELQSVARMVATRLRTWRACRYTPVEAEPTGRTVTISGVRAQLPLVRVGKRLIATTYGLAQTEKVAVRTEASYTLSRMLLGPKIAIWAPKRVYFLDRAVYGALIRGNHPSLEEQKARLRYGNYWGKGYYARWAATPERATAYYAHSVGFRTMRMRAGPGDRADKRWKPHAWVQEGFACLLSFELWGHSWAFTISPDETSGKVISVLEPEDSSTRVSLEWVRQNLLHGAADSLREVFGRSLNNLDRLATLQAWTFLRFLYLYDPIGGKKFPPALGAQLEGPMPDRADRALKEAFGKDTGELERLWRRFTLEIS